jgi:hypothetical protein
MPNFRFFRKSRAVIFGEMASATRPRLQKPGTTTGSLAIFTAIRRAIFRPPNHDGTVNFEGDQEIACLTEVGQN